MRTHVVAAAILLTAGATEAQQGLPVVRSQVPLISIRDGSELKASSWRLAPQAMPDVYEAELLHGRPHRVTFITDVDSIAFLVEEGKRYDFIVQKGDTLNYTQILGTRFVPAAVFDSAYRARHRGRTRIEIPEVYELVNVAIALTPTAIADRGLVAKDSRYHADMRQWFDAHGGHPVVAMLDSAMKQNSSMYFNLKMNGYAFEFDSKGRIVKSKVYDRINARRTNPLEPYIEQLQGFADATRFREFYSRNRATFDAQVAFYRDTADIAGMRTWLEGHFPGREPYQTYNIILSPLVGHNQSVTWFSSNGFAELQPHVNFPYAQNFQAGPLQGLSDESVRLYRGNILFTEINHGYINPEADRYADRIRSAISNRNRWVDSARGPGYYGGISAFNEYMNWVLVNLRLADLGPESERAQMISAVEQMMVRRGFPQFPAFSQFLLPLYTNRPPGRTLVELYPEIIDWFERNST